MRLKTLQFVKRAKNSNQKNVIAAIMNRMNTVTVHAVISVPDSLSNIFERSEIYSGIFISVMFMLNILF